jgi:hypothetical protein
LIGGRSPQEQQKPSLEKWTTEAPPEALEAHHESWGLTVESHPGAVAVRLGAVEAHPGAVEAHLGAIEAHSGDAEAYPEYTVSNP